VVGIWPRFLEPRWLLRDERSLFISHLPSALEGLKLLHLSDLHFNHYTKPALLHKVVQTAQQWQPDVICFTGDFLCYSQLEHPQSLVRFLRQLKAPLGCYAVLGNHDYNAYISMGSQGVSIVSQRKPFLIRALLKLFSKKKKNPPAKFALQPHPQLLECLSQSGFELLNNRTLRLQKGAATLCLAGVGDHWAGQDDVEGVLSSLPSDVFTLLLAHNPDSIDALFEKNLAGQVSLVLSGHAHGGQINLPFIRSHFSTVKDLHLQKGLAFKGKLPIYISQGLGSPYPLRFRARPQMTLLQLQRGDIANDICQKGECDAAH
jgi:hypothetical protein